MSDKISIRFFNDREVRAAWDSANSQWLFSVVDVIAILTGKQESTQLLEVMKHRAAKTETSWLQNANQLKITADGETLHRAGTSRKRKCFL